MKPQKELLWRLWVNSKAPRPECCGDACCNATDAARASFAASASVQHFLSDFGSWPGSCSGNSFEVRINTSFCSDMVTGSLTHITLNTIIKGSMVR